MRQRIIKLFVQGNSIHLDEGDTERKVGKVAKDERPGKEGANGHDLRIERTLSL